MARSCCGGVGVERGMHAASYFPPRPETSGQRLTGSSVDARLLVPGVLFRASAAALLPLPPVDKGRAVRCGGEGGTPSVRCVHHSKRVTGRKASAR